MPDNNIYWLCYLIIINLASAASVVSDKRKAQKHRRRIPERTLFLLAAAGGSPAMLAVMRMTSVSCTIIKFMVGLPVMMIVQLTLVCLIVRLF